MDRLALRGDERLLDAGCGSGELTAELVERLPRGRVVAVDASRSMLERAQERLADRADVRHADLLELHLDEPVDVVFSSATFHWIPDHPRLFAALRAALRPGGRLLAQYGGEGNIAEVQDALRAVVGEEAFAAHLTGWPGPWNFTSHHQATRWLREAGFSDLEAGTHIEPVEPDDPETFLRTVILGAHLDRLPEELQDPFVAAVLSRLDQPVRVEYVRLTVSARAT
jgi:trans-aconitate 2-methyltransferase